MNRTEQEIILLIVNDLFKKDINDIVIDEISNSKLHIKGKK